MGSFWDEIGKDRERRRREQQRIDSWLRREAAAEAKRTERAAATVARSSRAEEARLAREAGEEDARARNESLEARLTSLVGVLPATVALPPRTVDFLRQDVPTAEFVPPAADARRRRPVWADFAPAEPGIFGRRKYERSLREAQAVFARACEEFDRAENDRSAAAQHAHETEQAAIAEEHHRFWNALSDGLAQRDPDAVAEFAGAVVHALPPLQGLLSGGRAVYQPEPRELVVEISLPDTDIIPSERSWRYVASRRAVESLARSQKDAASRYSDLVSRIALAVMHACFSAFDRDLVDTISLNGHVPTVDPATGRPVRPCVITVTTSRAIFDGLVLDNERLSPPKCLAALGAELSPHPYQLDPVEPFVDFDIAKYRVVTAPEALVDLDASQDLLKMNPYDFERLVRDLFMNMGYETWRTKSSRDDGVDAVATRSDPIFPVECVIQAKRYTKAVPPKEVQALMGAMAESGTATHGVLVTTSWLSDRSRQRARAQRITTIERNELVYLIEKHLDRKVVISNRRPRR